jgi:uncharacterized protein GlcG (DUF336 family)
MTVYRRASLSSDTAQRMLEGAERHAQELGYPFSIAVVDESGVLKAFARMDGAVLLSVQIAQDKAYTAAGFGLPTEAWREMFHGDAVLGMAATAGIDRLVAIGGGTPVLVDGAIAGAVGVSGGTAEMDTAVARAALLAVEPVAEGGRAG